MSDPNSKSKKKKKTPPQLKIGYVINVLTTYT